MSDPRNVAHDKKVQQEKQHGKPNAEGKGSPAGAPPPTEAGHEGQADLEKSVAVLSKLKEMEFHSRANIETLAGLTLTIDDELKQKDFSDPVGALYSIEDQFHTKIAEVIASYETQVEKLKPSV
jgi:hypothetical protein